MSEIDSVVNISSTASLSKRKKDKADLPWLRVAGMSIVDEKGEVVSLNGINLSNNVWGNYNYSKRRLERPTVQDRWVLQDIDFELIKRLGCKAVRYAINYGLFARDNPNRESNLVLLKSHIEKFNKIGVYVIIDLHLPEGLDDQNDAEERKKPGNERLQSIFESKKYWADTLDMWRYLVRNLKNIPGVAGYDIFNEPRLPATVDCSMEEFIRKYNELCSVIRSEDKRHIIFVPEYISREANIGERYWDNNKSGWAIDGGEQGIIWNGGFVKVDDSNVVYETHYYQPYEFTNGAASPYFDAKTIERDISRKLSWVRTVGRAPLIVGEYGVDRAQPPEKRVLYLDAVHSTLHKYGISGFYFQYKDSVSSYSDPDTTFGLYGQYAGFCNEFDLGKDFKGYAIDAAKQNGFDLFYENAFLPSMLNPLFVYLQYYGGGCLDVNKPTLFPISLMDNYPVWVKLFNFFHSF